MSNILLWSDLHAYPFKSYSKILENGVNSRLQDALNCIEQIYNYAADSKNDIQLILFGGDMFHVRKTIHVQSFNAVYFALEKLSKICPIIMIHGNHDQSDKEGKDHSIYGLKNIVQIPEPGWYRHDRFNILTVPYTENNDHLRQIVKTKLPTGELNIFLGHLGIQGAKTGADFVYSNPYDPTISDLNPNAFDVGFLGHYHLHQHIGNTFYYIGAPLQHNWGDKDQYRGFLTYNVTNSIITKHPLKAPKFIELQEADLNDSEIKTMTDDNFVRVISDRNWELEEIDNYKKELNVRTFEVIPSGNNIKEHVTRLVINPATTTKNILQEYLNSELASTENLNKDYLLELGNSVIDSVEGDI